MAAPATIHGDIDVNSWFLRIALLGFIAGALAVLTFHQVGFWIATQLKLVNASFYSMRPVPPFGVPSIVSAAFWGGLWGIAAASLVPRLPGVLKGPLGWVLFAVIVVDLVNWFVVAPLKGAPIGYGWRAPGVYVVVVVYAFWGFGMWLFYSVGRRLLR